MTKAPRRRSEASRAAILAATFALLEEQGLERLSIEGVAARAGVGKTTIYRWWPGKGALAVEAFLHAISPAIAFRHGDSAAADIRGQMRALAALYRGPTGQLARQMIGFAQLDADMHQAFIEGFIKPRRQAAHEVLTRGVASGEFDETIDPEAALEALYGPIYYRLLVSGAPCDDAFLDAVADLVLPGLTSARPAAS